MKKLITMWAYLLTALVLSAQEETPAKDNVPEAKNQVILLPTIHSRHLRKGHFYDLKHLEFVLKDIKPDMICAEITPDAFAKWQKGEVDRRLSFFPEFSKVILKLDKELAYEVFPCSAYTAKHNFKTVGIKAMDKSHYDLIAKVLDKHTNTGKRVAISYGSGHINGLLEHLRKRKDIEIIDYRPTLAKHQKEYLKKKQQ